MNVMTERVRFWETVYHLITKEGMRLVQINEDEDVVWIEDDRKEPYQIIRISRKDYDWSNQLRGDIERVKKSSENVRKRLNLRQANVVNLILSNQFPVDDYRPLLSEPLPFTAGGKKQFRTIMLVTSEIEQQFFPLATEWKLNETPNYMPKWQIEQEEAEDEWIRYLQIQVKQSTKERQRKDQELFLFGKPTFTSLLIGLILAVFLYIETVANTQSPLTLIEFGAKFDPLILEGEWWRFFSAMFLHIGLLHLMMNSLALFYLGGAVERIFGTKRFIFIYFLAGFIGSVSSFVFNDNISAGASGAIFGCFGALLYFGLVHKRLFFRTIGMSLIVILAINLVFGFVVPMVDNGAHIGGLVGGFAGAVITGLPKHKEKFFRKTGLFVTAVAAAALLWIGYDQDIDPNQLSSIYLQVGSEWIEREEPEKASSYFNDVAAMEEEISPELYVNALFMQAYADVQMERYSEAERLFREVIELNPEFHEAYYNLALVLHEQGDSDEASVYIDRAVELAPENTNYQELQEEIQ
ncbi:rhomboid protease GluP [Salisediminibacterium halotolerans]|nr:rhomboid protease GluP [Actinophytocola xinjiangensis]RPE88552.1 rhomboid protease GluP [Salisediminibacterium halotolerans]TWG37086.1 rhomboid protease GluP [Salisediminibacterium halotolerans]GEL09033.1 rhomboid protease GluP [Salisediminibacterium halotolerans]